MLSDFDDKGKKTGTEGKVATVITKDKGKKKLTYQKKKKKKLQQKFKPLLTWIGLGKARVCPYIIFFRALPNVQLQDM